MLSPVSVCQETVRQTHSQSNHVTLTKRTPYKRLPYRNLYNFYVNCLPLTLGNAPQPSERKKDARMAAGGKLSLKSKAFCADCRQPKAPGFSSAANQMLQCI